MTILITADLHLDLWADAGRDPFSGILPVLRDLDALILAGDLANDAQRNWPRALSRLGRLVAPDRNWVSLVAPMREMSMMVGAIMGMLILREAVGPWRLVGCGVVIAGVILLSGA